MCESKTPANTDIIDSFSWSEVSGHREGEARLKPLGELDRCGAWTGHGMFLARKLQERLKL